MTIINSDEECVRRWTESEGKELDTWSEWIKAIRILLKPRIYQWMGKFVLIFLSL
jgi:hypothetical protein